MFRCWSSERTAGDDSSARALRTTRVTPSGPPSPPCPTFLPQPPRVEVFSDTHKWLIQSGWRDDGKWETEKTTSEWITETINIEYVMENKMLKKIT